MTDLICSQPKNFELQLVVLHESSCTLFQQVDFETFLTMTESDLKEIGISTLGARRRLQIAISGE